MLKGAQVMAVRQTYHGNMLVILAGFFKVFGRGLFRKSLVKSKRSNKFLSRKILKITEYVSY